MASKLLTPTYKWTPSEKTTYATPKPATITPTYKWTPSEKTTYATPKPVTISPTYNWTPSEKTTYVTPNTPTIVPTSQWTPSKVPTSKAKTLTPTALNRGESSSVPTVEGVDVSGMAISAQKQVKTDTGGWKTITKLGENSYSVVEYAADGHMIRAVNVKPGLVSSTLGSAAPSESSSVTPASSTITEKASTAAKSVTPVAVPTTPAVTPSIPAVTSSPTADSTGTTPAVPTGDSNWRAANEGGQATPVTAFDLTAVCGVTAFGKYILKKLAAKAAATVSQSEAPGYLDDLKYRLEHGELSDDEYYTILNDYIKQEQAAGKTLTSIFDEVTATTQTFFENGGVGLSANFASALDKYVASTGIVETTPTIQTQSSDDDNGLFGWLGDKYDKYAPDVVKEAVVTVEEGIFGSDEGATKEEPVSAASIPSSAPVEASSSLKPSDEVQFPPVEDQVSSVSSDPLLAAVTGDALNQVYTLDLEGGNVYPVTDEEKAAEARRYLDDHYPTQAAAGQDNELIAKYFWFMVPQLSQNGVDYHTLADTARSYENLVTGDVATLLSYDETLPRDVIISEGFTGLGSLTQSQEQSVIESFNKQMIENDIPAPVMALFNAGLAEACDSKATSIRNWMTSGGLSDDIKEDWIWVQKNNVGDWLSSEQGMAAVGAGFGLIGTVGAFMVAGPIAATATLGTLPFQTTEFFQSFGEQAFKTKGELQLSGEYSQDHVSALNSVYSASNSAISNIGFAKSMNDPTVNLQNIANAETALKSSQQSTADNWAYLEAANVYNDKVRQLQIQESAFETNKAMFDAQGNYIAKDNPPIEVKVINADKTWKISYENLYGRGDGSFTLGKLSDNFVGDVVITDGSGNEIGRQQLKSQLFSGDQVIDAESIVKQSQKYSGKSGSASSTYKRTIVLQPGQSMEFAGKTYSAGDKAVAYDVTLYEGIPTRIKFSQEGKESKVEYFGAQGVAWGTYTPVLEDAFTKAPEEVVNQGFELITSPSSTVKINGKVFTPSGEKNVVPVAPGYYSVEVSTPGKETWQKTVYIGEGQYMAISDASQDIEEPWSSDYSSGGSSGGSGGSYGGSGGSASYALIVYGETCRDATILQDDQQVYPEIGKAYSISPGYHGIVVKKTGKKDWTKTVYCMAGDSIEVSPALEDATDSNGTDTSGTNTSGTDTTSTKSTKRVYFNSEPSSARVMINGGFSGEWTPCFLDLEAGYYKIQILKTGYKAQDHTLYVGSVIAWDLYADQLAKQEGIYYD